ncbi:hypothetical protein LTR36_005669 [Oleoguttula mirabilis]|uniref:Uncharacterized protein n=1 Tax=Oleoguttula mirabilis TaxID=1507867 RepID=A0AAV9JEY0_9PEZI|nr:hypothetical protein LTR36_005669 [Oleoguttula mirabilis]
MDYPPATFEDPPPPMPPLGHRDTRTAKEKTQRHLYLARDIVLGKATSDVLYAHLPSAEALFQLSYALDMEYAETGWLRDLAVSLLGGDVARAYHTKYLQTPENIQWLAPLDAYGLWCSNDEGEILQLANEAVEHNATFIRSAIDFALLADGTLRQTDSEIENIETVMERQYKDSWLIKVDNIHLRLMLAELTNRHPLDQEAQDYQDKYVLMAVKGMRRSLTTAPHEDYPPPDYDDPWTQLSVALYDDRLDYVWHWVLELYDHCPKEAWREYFDLVCEGSPLPSDHTVEMLMAMGSDEKKCFLDKFGIDLVPKLRLYIPDNVVDALRIWVHLAAEFVWCWYLNRDWFHKEADIIFKTKRVVCRIPDRDVRGSARPLWIKQAEEKHEHFVVVYGEWPEIVTARGNILGSDRLALLPL